MLTLSLASLTLLPILLTGQAPSGGAAERGPDDSLRLLVLAPADQILRLDQLGFHAHAHMVRQDGAWTTAEVIVPERDLPHLRAALPGAVIRIEERSRPFRDIVASWPKVPGAPPDPNYRTGAEILADLQSLESRYPQLCRLYDFQSRYGVPMTHEGRRIHLLRISDNPGVDEDEPNLVVQANHHCRELNSIEVPFFAAEQLLTSYGSDPLLTRLVDENQIWIIPTMNPDGLNTVWTSNNMWRKNRRNNGDGSFGVDLNRNYPYFWAQCGSSSRTSSDTYHGPSAASEPETQAMLAFATAEGIERLIDIHSYAQEVRAPHNPLNSGNLPSMVTQYYGPLHQALATAMSYAPTASCCCGTHMEYHHSTHGTMAFLVEMGTGFQPPWSQTVTELQLIWPGVRAFLTESSPMRGHVRSMDGQTPLSAEVTVQGQSFVDGQKIQSIGRAGRYSLWIAPGTWDLTFTAPGHEPRVVRRTLSAGTTVEQDVVLEPRLRPTTLSANGAPRIGQTVRLDLSSPDDGARPYFLPVSLWAVPPIQLGQRTIPIAASFLLDIELAAPTIFVNVFGTLDSAGRTTAQFAIPTDPNLVGLDFFFAGLTFKPSYPFGIRGISDNVKLSVTN